MKKLLVLALIISFSLFFSSKAYAYSEIPYNSHFDSTAKGIIVFNTFNGTYAWNDTCDGATGCIIYVSNATGSELTFSPSYVWANEWSPVWDDLTAYSNFTNYWDMLDLPLDATKDGIVGVSYRLNDTVSTPQAQLRIWVGGSFFDAVDLNTTPNVWHNVSYVLNSTNGRRNIKFYFYVKTDNKPTMLEFDRFNFYTLDTVASRTSWLTPDAEFTNYCGPNANQLCGYVVANETGALAGLTEDNVPCMAVKLANTTIASRITSNESYDTTDTCPAKQTGTSFGWFSCRNGLFSTKYGYLFHEEHNGASCVWDNTIGVKYFVEALSLTSGKFTWISTLNNYSVFYPNDEGRFYTNGNGSISIAKTIQPLNSVKIDQRNIIRATLPLNVSPALPSGTQWKWRTLELDNNFANSSWHDFFSVSNVCPTGIFCDAGTNFQYFQDANCQINDSSKTWCGSWGCGGNLIQGVGCAFGFTGTYCADNFTQVGVDANGTTTSISCYPQNCYNLTVSGGIVGVCLSQSGYEAYLNGTAYPNGTAIPGATSTNVCTRIDGTKVLCTSLPFIEQITTSAFGHDVSTADTLFTVIMAIILSVAGLLFAPTEKKGEIFLILFIAVIFVGALYFQTVYLWLAFAVFVVLIAIALSSGLRKIIFGG